MPLAANPAPRPFPRSFIRQRDLIMWLPSTRLPSLLINPTRPHPLVSRGSLYLLAELIILFASYALSNCNIACSEFTLKNVQVQGRTRGRAEAYFLYVEAKNPQS